MDKVHLEKVSSKKKAVMTQLNIQTYNGPLHFETEYLLRPNDQHDTTQKGSAHRIFSESNSLKSGIIKPLNYEYHIRSELPRVAKKTNEIK